MERNLRAIYLLLIAANGLAWIGAFLALQHNSVLMGATALAYTFGLRHAFASDQIAAIDNRSPKFFQLNKKPLTIGLFFSFGHTAVLLLATIAIVSGFTQMNEQGMKANEMAGELGAIVAAVFLLFMATVTLTIAFSSVALSWMWWKLGWRGLRSGIGMEDWRPRRSPFDRAPSNRPELVPPNSNTVRDGAARSEPS